MNNEEIWKPIQGYEGLYEVSNIGRVRSCERTVKRCNNIMKIHSKVLTLNNSYGGYQRVTLFDNEHKCKSFAVHRLVAQVFLNDYKDSMDVDHINGVRDDNRVENLRMCTRKENCNYELSRYNKRQSSFKKAVLQFDLQGNFLEE